MGLKKEMLWWVTAFPHKWGRRVDALKLVPTMMKISLHSGNQNPLITKAKGLKSILNQTHTSFSTEIQPPTSILSA